MGILDPSPPADTDHHDHGPNEPLEYRGASALELGGAVVTEHQEVHHRAHASSNPPLS